MKTPASLFKTLLFLLLLAAGSENVFAQQDSCYTFFIHPRINHHPVAFDSINVYSQTHHVGISLYYPDSVYNNCTTGIQSFSGDFPVFQLDTKGANPFSSSTIIEITSSQNIKGKMRIVDMLGHICMEKDWMIAKGASQYRVSIPQSGMYICMVEGGGQRLSQKLVALEGNGKGTGDFNVELLGMQEGNLKDAILRSTVPISEGDRVNFVVAHTINSQVVMSHKYISSIGSPGDYHILIDMLYRIDCENFSLANCEVQVVDDASSESSFYTTLFGTYPPRVYCNVTFYDSTFVAVPTEFSGYSETPFGRCSGEYKYRLEQVSEYYYQLFYCTMTQNINETSCYTPIIVYDCDGFDFVEYYMDAVDSDGGVITRRF